MAKRLNLDPSTLSRWENGFRNPTGSEGVAYRTALQRWETEQNTYITNWLEVFDAWCEQGRPGDFGDFLEQHPNQLAITAYSERTPADRLAEVELPGLARGLTTSG